MKRYNIIYADPPWSYKDKALAGKRGVCCKYPTMTLQDICHLSVSQITAGNCVLFMWITMPLEQHSKKPDIVRERIVELMGDLPRVELFARQRTDGWDAWGDEVVSDPVFSATGGRPM